MATTRKKAAAKSEELPLLQKATPMQLMMGVLCVCALVLAGSAVYAAHNVGSTSISEDWRHVWQTRGNKARWCRTYNVKQMTILCSDWN